MTSLPSSSGRSPAPGLSALLREQAVLLEELDRRQRTNILDRYRPYAKQREFHLAGAAFRERLFMAGNQLGKTLAGAAEAAMHLTGRYPDWWQGKRFGKPVVMLAGSESYELTRDGVQRLLVGPPLNEEDWGTGFIPKAAIIATTRRSGASGALDSVTVRHLSGGASTLLFKAYEQGRGKWQANTVDYVWFDEEPPEDVYFEGITRTNATRGSVAVTFTPLKGLSAVVARYLMEKSPDREVITMTIEDAEHYTPEERQRIIDSYQFMRATLIGLANEIPSISGRDLFAPDLQDPLAFHLLKRRGFAAFITGEIGLAEFGKRLAMEWASLPVLADADGERRPVKRGQSYYAGDGLNKALVEPEKVEAVLRAVLTAARSRDTGRDQPAEASAARPVPRRKAVARSARFWTWLLTAGGTIITALKELNLVALDWRVQLAILAAIIGFAVYAISSMPTVRDALGLRR
ncbi:terminase family protein [Sinorhizobium numidicum]|uniref:Terminase family protein n=1 Tax=Sinorhizobium numidicum TaxID=680248 RepID=A0ABY8CW25_9HYPH|nr:terminase family protein [Sinorhizobium numidicum]WEX76171.1 terminase family protein [Sinorhizobium numidicum]WEX82830.1 terminase family protein [Sinorhizobium numidicum]